MAARVQGNTDGGVTEAFGDDLEVHAGLQELGSVRVAIARGRPGGRIVPIAALKYPCPPADSSAAAPDCRNAAADATKYRERASWRSGGACRTIGSGARGSGSMQTDDASVPDTRRGAVMQPSGGGD